MKIALQIVTHPIEFAKAVKSGIECGLKKNYYCIGKAIGDILRIIFLSRTEEEVGDPAQDFLKGFLEGLRVKEDIEKMMKCIKSFEHLIQKLTEAFKYLTKINLGDLMKGLKILFDAITQFLREIKPCAESSSIINKLIHLISNAHLMKIALKIITHPVEFIRDVESCIRCLTQKNFFCVGKSLGDILWIIFLSRTEEEVGDPAHDFLRGFLDGLQVGEDIQKMLKCVKNVETLLGRLQQAFEHLKTLKLEEIKKGLTILFGAVKEFLMQIKPCADSASVINKLIHLISNANIAKIALQILTHPIEFARAVQSGITCIMNRNFYCIGKAVGDILRIIFLSRTE
jgi:DNA-binding transcriptional regulator GbsR (MarR family)